MDASALVKAVSSAENSLDSLAVWLVIANVAIVVGLFIEYWPDIRKLSVSFPIDKMLVIELMGGALVTLGVEAELRLVFDQSKAENELRAAVNTYIGVLQKEASAADSHAADASAVAAQAQLALAKIKQPRNLTHDQISAVTTALKPFSGQKYDLRRPGMLEPWSFLDVQLLIALHNAGWQLQSAKNCGLTTRLLGAADFIAATYGLVWGGRSSPSPLPEIVVCEDNSADGLIVGTDPPGHLTPATMALIKVLTDADLAPASEAIPGLGDDNTIHIIIGRKIP